MKTLSTVIIIGVLIVAGILVFKDRNSNTANNSEVTTETTNTGTTESTTTGSVDITTPVGGVSSEVTTGEIKKFTVTGKNFSYTPNTLNVNKGDQVEITFINSQGMHDFVVDGYQARTKIIKTGEKEILTFSADKAGTFEFYCSVGEHRQMGMVGKFIVK